MWEMCQGEVCTDDDTDADDANANDGQSMIVLGSLVDKPNEPKIAQVPNSSPGPIFRGNSVSAHLFTITYILGIFMLFTFEYSLN